ncbi:D-sedoheptulose 7-phosphate isomerase [Novimethylophilus kurashikiensis]|uniref:Phosphoheptose isomerase n=1 Tax=Novimethylophilus kurashikiensis TaxID=1825523 RepID=A0A2R5F4T1_9PROT|nr:D-sedoheptulose 7-phosphate isomerase [Novimethylophilus kurashikiensis]GBG13410.1 D-sedoheptulose 7-phosphate isomerase [Novimethylophilus kurashikiensis]
MLIADTIRSAISAHRDTIAQLDALVPEIERLAKMMMETLERGGKILWMGNGGSAADSQHMAAEFVGRYVKERRGLPSIALTTDTSILTSVGNDYGYDYVFARQIEALCTEKDLVVGISTSGNSPNVLRAIEAAKAIGATTVGWTGEGKGKLGELCDMTLAAPSKVTARIQEAHILIGHILCELVDDANTPD